jgi:hypothetical protein
MPYVPLDRINAGGLGLKSSRHEKDVKVAVAKREIVACCGKIVSLK